ncbi:MAG: hypothetical protein WBA17_03185 [Saprospiraceae bacterium]
MHEIEPHYQWRDRYIAADDPASPFYGRTYNEFGFDNQVYNYLLHPQWDDIGSDTLYVKIIFADYEEGYAIIELIGEWNDALHNDVMYLKRAVIDQLVEAGIYRYILIAENVLNFHGDDDSYYEEWYDDIRDDDGWIVILNLLHHVAEEMTDTRLDRYVSYGEIFQTINWRPQKPQRIYAAIEGLLQTKVKRVY